jgi:hypothetical protein
MLCSSEILDRRWNGRGGGRLVLVEVISVLALGVLEAEHSDGWLLLYMGGQKAVVRVRVAWDPKCWLRLGESWR